jgi:hypothetical protein
MRRVARSASRTNGSLGHTENCKSRRKEIDSAGRVEDRRCSWNPCLGVVGAVMMLAKLERPVRAVAANGIVDAPCRDSSFKSVSDMEVQYE